MTDVPPHATRQAKTAADPIVAVRWSRAKDAVRIIDQRALPERLVELEVSSLDDVCACINTLAVRGAPLIGVFAAMGLAALMRRHADLPRTAFDERLEAAAAAIRATRPTAANLGSALERMLACARAAAGEPLGVAQALWRTAESIRVEDAAMCQRIGEHAQGLIPYAARILTHCNTGVLATAGSGTALAGVYRAHAAGRRPSVYACETRPLLQGSRLTAWELQRCGIPVTLIADSMAAAL
ncbi:MAG: S-methyl-5-thioribose-1-phosphate isomerase, partial [Gemmatimonadaceae bacterium]